MKTIFSKYIYIYTAHHTKLMFQKLIAKICRVKHRRKRIDADVHEHNNATILKIYI